MTLAVSFYAITLGLHCVWGYSNFSKYMPPCSLQDRQASVMSTTISHLMELATWAILLWPTPYNAELQFSFAKLTVSLDNHHFWHGSLQIQCLWAQYSHMTGSSNYLNVFKAMILVTAHNWWLITNEYINACWLPWLLTVHHAMNSLKFLPLHCIWMQCSAMISQTLKPPTMASIPSNFFAQLMSMINCLIDHNISSTIKNGFLDRYLHYTKALMPLSQHFIHFIIHPDITCFCFTLWLPSYMNF